MAAIPLPAQNAAAPIRKRVDTRRRAHARSMAIRRSLVFALVAGASFMASSLMGNVMLEKARQEGKQAMRRTAAAREYQSTLQRQVIRLHSSTSVQSWAAANGFVASDSLSHPSFEDRRVALQR